MISLDTAFAERFCQELRAYLKKEGLVNADGQPSLGRLGATQLTDELQRYFDHTCEHLGLRPRAKREVFIPPTPEQVTSYSFEIEWPIDGVQFCESYQTKNWCTSGTTKMRDWKSAVRKWKASGIKTHKTPSRPTTSADKTEPLGWLDFMQGEFPDWVRFQTGETPVWHQLRQDERAFVHEKMAIGRTPSADRG